MIRMMTAVMLLVSGQTTWAESAPVLDADFEDLAVDEPIGLGGAALGQPISVASGLAAIVRDNVMASRSLELAWEDGSRPTVSVVRFEFLDTLEADDGELIIEFDIQPEILSRYGVDLRESGGSTRIFGSILLLANGSIRAGDIGNVVADATYSAGELVSVRWVHDLSKRVHSLEIKGVEAFTDRPHPVADRGIGSILFSLQANTADETTLHIDNLRVTWQPDGIFSDRFAEDFE